MPAKRCPKVPVPSGVRWWGELPHHPLNDALGLEMRAQRAIRGWSLEDLHRATGLAKSHLSDLEHGSHNFSLEVILLLEAAFGMADNELLTLARCRL